MKNIVKVFTLMLGFLFLFAWQVTAEDLFFLEDAGSARAIGLGLAYSVVVDEPDALIWNPAGLSFASGAGSPPVNEVKLTTFPLLL